MDCCSDEVDVDIAMRIQMVEDKIDVGHEIMIEQLNDFSERLGKLENSVSENELDNFRQDIEFLKMASCRSQRCMTASEPSTSTERVTKKTTVQPVVSVYKTPFALEDVSDEVRVNITPFMPFTRDHKDLLTPVQYAYFLWYCKQSSESLITKAATQ